MKRSHLIAAALILAALAYQLGTWSATRNATASAELLTAARTDAARLELADYSAAELHAWLQANPRHALADYTRQTLAEIAKGPIPGARPVPMLQTLQTMAAK